MDFRKMPKQLSSTTGISNFWKVFFSAMKVFLKITKVVTKIREFKSAYARILRRANSWHERTADTRELKSSWHKRAHYWYLDPPNHRGTVWTHNWDKSTQFALSFAPNIIKIFNKLLEISQFEGPRSLHIIQCNK